MADDVERGLWPLLTGVRGRRPAPPTETPPDSPFPPAEDLRLFADALAEPCLILDRRAVVLHANPAARAQFPGVAINSPIAFALRFPALLGAVEAARRGQPQTVEMHQPIPTDNWFKVSVAPLGRGGLLLVTMRSLTEEKRLEALRTDFVANASHELRTPLTSLIGFIDTLLGPAAGDAEARKRFLNIMRGQAARMSKLIDDLLSLSRIEMRQHMRPTGSVALAPLLREVTEGLAQVAAESNVEIRLALPDEPLTITGDRDELYEVLENLLDNALKYGADGKTVELTLSAANRTGFAALVSVVDHGPGVAAEHVPRLTERFYRVDAESSRRKKGTGLGLAIVKHIVNRHQGVLTIRSEVGVGTRVDVLLPL
jgi:two-component system, OmpR family, phosphate regulon sensor histidine kinase PhoR